MTRTFIIILTIFISTMANGQDTTFDRKVQQLFFDVDVSSHSTSLVNTFTNIKELTYKKPNRYGVHRLTGVDWTHTFKFTKQLYLTGHFDAGSIEIKISEHDNTKSVTNIFWTLQFDHLEDAKNKFNELKTYFTQTKAVSKFYSSGLAIETAEFTDKTAQKYPYIMFMLFDNDNLDKQYKIIVSLDNEMHYEN